jgi:carboxyl-terminal processing protease
LNPLRPFIWSANESPSNDPGTIKITIRKFYRVSGASTQLKGVTPDIVLPDTLNHSIDIGESSLPNALPWDTIDKANYNPLNLVQTYLPELRRLSDARVATNQDFVYIRQDIDEFTKLQADKTASLNEREELERAEQNALRQKARDAERAKRKAPDKKIYEITVENANQPGLPPMRWPTNMVTALVSTNTAATVSTNSPPPTDPWLDESEHILENYVSLMETNHAAVTNQ